MAPKTKSKARSTHSRAGLTFPVGRILRTMKRESTGRVSKDAAIYMSAALEYLHAELSAVAIADAIKYNKPDKKKKNRITIRDSNVVRCYTDDSDLGKILHARKPPTPYGGILAPSEGKKKKKKD